MSLRREPDRPFFAFLNYLDAHSNYLLPPGAPYRFGEAPETDADVQVLSEWIRLDKLRLPAHYRELARDCYDSCLAYLDERLGELFGELERRGILDNTLVIVASDHGEGLGEHGLFFHGETLYRTEIHVPLLIALPGQVRPATVSAPVSLRDLPATIVDVSGQFDRGTVPGPVAGPVLAGVPHDGDVPARRSGDLRTDGSQSGESEPRSVSLSSGSAGLDRDWRLCLHL